MIEKLIEELGGAQVIEVEAGTLICNKFGIPEYMVFNEEGEEDDNGETN